MSMNPVNRWRRYLSESVVILSVPFYAQELWGKQSASQSDQPYHGVPPVAADQAQVVYYRSAEGGGSGVALRMCISIASSTPAYC